MTTDTPAWRYSTIEDMPSAFRPIETLEIEEGDLDELWTRVVVAGLDKDGTLLLVQQYGVRRRYPETETWDLCDDPTPEQLRHWARELEALYRQHEEEWEHLDDDTEEEPEDDGAPF